MLLSMSLAILLSMLLNKVSDYLKQAIKLFRGSYDYDLSYYDEDKIIWTKKTLYRVIYNVLLIYCCLIR